MKQLMAGGGVALIGITLVTEIARGGADPDTFMDGICTMVQEIVSTYSCISEDGKKLFAPEKEVIGT